MPAAVRDIKSGRKTKLSADNPPELPVTIPATPDGLTDAEAVVFVSMATKLAGMRVMNEACVEALVIYCRNWVEAVNAHQKLCDSDLIVKSPKGYPMLNPYLPIRRKAEERCLKILAEFGMTPSSMTRVNTIPP